MIKDFILLFKYLKQFFFVYFERERERERASMSRGGTEREGERIPSRLHTVSSVPDAELRFTNHEIMT